MKLTRKQVFLGIGLAFVVLVVIVGIIGDTDDKAETTPLPTPTSVPMKTELRRLDTPDRRHQRPGTDATGLHSHAGYEQSGASVPVGT